ncbi:PaaI family thioesterase [Desulfotomaculum sp. 1211_IL3151]|uniref:PaaI family thioesterase n=1 Tax=Desulfotomaculum sp. 1211_IL3151 TaxID=3084055 RepID=UPI002FD97535
MEPKIQEMINAVNENPFGKMLNIELTELNTGESSVEITVLPHHLNPHGTLHGGVMATMADIAMGVAVRTLGKVGMTINLNTNFIATALLGERVIARGKVVHDGNSIASVECTVSRGEDILARSTGVWYLLKNK